MTRRVVIGNVGGTFYFRSSPVGVDAVTGDPSYLSAYEGMVPCVPKASGTIVVPAAASNNGGATASVALSQSFSYPPFILIKSTDNILPGGDTIGGWFVAGSTPNIYFFNRSGSTKTVKWWAFAEL
jgi:hypothetical protein